MDNFDEFLAELTELTKKYKLVIMGCGCCGSPWVQEFEPKRYEDKNIDNYKYVNGPRTGGDIGFEAPEIELPADYYQAFDNPA